MMKKIIEKLKTLFKSVFIYVVIISSAVASFFVGMYYQSMNKNPKKYQITKVHKKDIVLAVDEYNNLIVIEKSTGDYTIFQDSIGNSIFKIYANKVLSQNTNTIK
jgi:hypothetical protein